MSIFVLISMFGVLATITMLVQENKKNIAILSAMGMPKNHIAQIFFFCGMAIVLFGGIFGCILGVFFAQNIQSIRIILEKLLHVDLFNSSIYFLSTLPVYTHVSDIFLIFSLCVVFGVLCSVLPAMKALKVSPADSLRYF